MRVHLLIFFFIVTTTLYSQTTRDTIIVGYTSAPPFIIQSDGALEGINVWMWQRVAQDLEIPYELKLMGFSEMLDSLKTGGIDLSINPLTITGERSKQFEFTHSFYASNATIAISEYSSLEKIKRLLQNFLNLNVLRGLLALLAIISVFGFLGWYFERKKNPTHFRKGIKGIWDGLWWSAVTLTTVGYGDKAPKSSFGKLAALILMFTGLLFISGLTAGIASSLTVNQLNNNPEGFNAFKGREVGTIKNSGTVQFLQSHFFKRIQEFEGVNHGLEALKNNMIEAFIYDEPILKYRIQQNTEFTSLSIMPIKFDMQFYAFGLAKNQTILEQAISQRMLELMETREWQLVLNEYGLNEL